MSSQRIDDKDRAQTHSASVRYSWWLANVQLNSILYGARCSPVVKSVRSWCDGSSDRSFMGWTHWAISRSSQCSTTGVPKAVVCVIHIGYSYRLTARVLLYAPSHRQDNTYHGLCYTSRGTLAGTRNSSMGPPHEGSIRRPIAPWANALTTELHLAPVS